MPNIPPKTQNESVLMQLVLAMHMKFGLQNTDGPTVLNEEEKRFRIAAMREEIQEYEEAQDLVTLYDSLLDLIVFAVGTLERHGLPLLPGFEAVMLANMAKEVGQNGNKRGGFKRDLVKPAGWVGPETELAHIINQACDRVDGKEPKAKPLAVPGPQLVTADREPIIAGQAPKFDSNKVRVDLLPVDPMLQIADVFGYGALKYFANSYRSGETVAWSRTYGSILRHLFMFWDGQDVDPESGKHHLAHAGTQLMILMEHVANNPDKDDRFNRKGEAA